MFLQSSTKYIKPELNDFADKIEKDSPGLSVFAARQFCYQLYQTPIQIEITQERDLNILEEFILRVLVAVERVTVVGSVGKGCLRKEIVLCWSSFRLRACLSHSCGDATERVNEQNKVQRARTCNRRYTPVGEDPALYSAASLGSRTS